MMEEHNLLNHLPLISELKDASFRSDTSWFKVMHCASCKFCFS